VDMWKEQCGRTFSHFAESLPPSWDDVLTSDLFLLLLLLMMATPRGWWR
jgi:hypothetical protein